MLLFLSILGIFLSAILLYFNRRNNTSSAYLGVFFILLSVYCFNQYILVYSKSVFLILFFLENLVFITSPLYLAGPALYFYIRSSLTDNPRLTRTDLLHLLPMVIYFLFAFPHLFTPFAQKMEAALSVVNDLSYIKLYKATLLSEIFPPSALYLSRPILVLAYALWSAILFVRYLIQNNISAVFPRQKFMTKWLFLLLGLTLILALSHVLLIIRIFAMEFSTVFFTLNFLRILSSSGLIALLVSPFFFPYILYGLPRFPKSATTADNSGEKPEGGLIKSKRKDANHFEWVYMNDIGQKADSYMKEKKKYLQPDFNLVQLSANIQIPIHHLNYYFREHKKQHFGEYRNQLRIKHAKKLIEEGKASELTLEAIGRLSGFKSRNSFTQAFEKFEGISPKDFAARKREQNIISSN